MNAPAAQPLLSSCRVAVTGRLICGIVLTIIPLFSSASLLRPVVTGTEFDMFEQHKGEIRFNKQFIKIQ
jgi:hypothetical protein